MAGSWKTTATVKPGGVIELVLRELTAGEEVEVVVHRRGTAPCASSSPRPGFGSARGNRVIADEDLPERFRRPPADFSIIDGVTTVGLAELIGMKLRRGSRDPLRAQDLADVIGLIRQCRLRGNFAPKVDKDVQPEFRKLARLVTREQTRGS